MAEGQSERDFRKTHRSVTDQRGSQGTVIRVASGAPLSTIREQITADFLMFIRAGSELRANALTEIAKLHRVDPAVQLIDFDSDVRHRFGRRRSPQFKPSWSPEMLLGANYLGRAFAIKRSSVQGETDPAINDRGVWQLLLSEDWKARSVGRLSKVLLTEPQRNVRALTRADADLVVASLARRGEHATATIAPDNVVRVAFQPREWPSVSIVIPTRHSRANLELLFPSLATTDYPSLEIRLMDNGPQTEDNVAWYAEQAAALPLSVTWWTETPFNYSRVNNAGVALTSGEVVVMLNDDTEIVDPQWLKEMVGVLLREGVGTVGAQLRYGDGRIQHGGVVVGPGGFADNLFAGMEPNSETLIGPTSWYRNSLAVTGACVAIRRSDFDDCGGLDERFVLCGSDVVLGLDQIIRGRRNAVIPFDIVRHHESLTRGTSVPREDFYASYFRYHPWLQNGDPYLSPNVSPLSAQPRFRRNDDASPVRLALTVVGRGHANLAQSSGISEEAKGLIDKATATAEQVQAIHDLHASNADFRDVRTINWFVPDIDMPFFGGLNTAFRIADQLAREHGVINRFVMLAAENRAYVEGALAAAFPGLAGSEIIFYHGHDDHIAQIPPADAAVATLWLTAYHVAKSQGVKRKFYLVQDYEPMFYPASSMYAMAEESYKLGLYGICNTESMYRSYTQEYGGKATVFTPAVDARWFNTTDRRVKEPEEPVTIFAYARDHFRNCWELVFAALTEIKKIHGDGVKIIAAGARYLPQSADFVDMGLLDYRATGNVYRETDIGVTMQISRHPSYLPLELMASGVAMVAPDSEWFEWLFTNGSNSALTMRTVDDLVAKIDKLVRDQKLRQSVSSAAVSTIKKNHSSWDSALGGIFEYMNNPEG
jgi:GT2 family glycosyltransferase/glycosyltransferase involved in cell wall biosynthesis